MAEEGLASRDIAAAIGEHLGLPTAPPPRVEGMDVPHITLGAVNLEAEDPALVARFWAEVIGSTPAPGGDAYYLPPSGPGGFAMFVQPLTGPRTERSTIHLDLTVPWGDRDGEVARIVSLGATWRWDVLDEVPHVRWTTLADPEGNLFCVAEHPPAASPVS
ncbi:MAG: hypothetical protein JWO76_3556 [Nocardioides sp.]|nr:hypothetical protein [Nocardioides sp.]